MGRHTGAMQDGDERKTIMRILSVEQSKISPSGQVKVSAWKPGLIGEMITRGMNLREAMAACSDIGALFYERETHNLVTTVGRQFIARHLSGEDTVGLTYLALGTGTTPPAISDTTLVSESMRKVLTECYQGSNYVYSSAFILSSQCTFYIKEGGLFGGILANAVADSGSMFCRFLLDYDNSAGDDLTVQHIGEIL